MMHATLFGTLYLHQGQELGLVNLPSDWLLEEWKDCKTQNVAKKLVNKGSSPLTARIITKGQNVDTLLKKVYHKARDNGRSPMQVSSTEDCRVGPH